MGGGSRLGEGIEWWRQEGEGVSGQMGYDGRRGGGGGKGRVRVGSEGEGGGEAGRLCKQKTL